MSLWNSFFYSFKEFHYLFLSVVIIFIFNILLEYNNFLKFKNQKHYVGGKIKCRKRKIKCRIFATNYLSFNLKLKL
ncbi:hypothetical protein GUK24_02425 [Campylobacter jejuni]|nr:hypothetical protein [Campylobacter jejuni]